MARTRRPVMALTPLLLIACSLTQLFAPPPNQPFNMTATAIIATNYWIETVIAQTETARSTPAPCYFNWAAQDLPELTAEIQSALDAAGLENVTITASAYGENCYALDTNEARYFAVMETDFSVTAIVDDLEDEEALGDLTAEILSVLNEFPPDATPGPQPGYITLTFVAGDARRNLRFSVTQADTALEQGLVGEALLQALNGQR